MLRKNQCYQNPSFSSRNKTKEPLLWNIELKSLFSMKQTFYAMKSIKSFSILVVFLIISSCGGLKRINPLSLLTGNSWALATLMGKELDLSLFSETVPRLDFLAGGKLAGFSGCNNFSGSFSLEGTAVKLDPGAITKKACSGMGEQAFITAIGRVSQLKVDKGKLTLLLGDSELMSFVPIND